MNEPISSEFLKLLRCPVSHGALQIASDSLLQSLNLAIQDGGLHNRVGQRIEAVLQAGLVSPEAKLLLPIRDGIVIMIPDQAIPLDFEQLDE